MRYVVRLTGGVSDESSRAYLRHSDWLGDNMWSENEFLKEREESSFSIKLLYWFPTAEMLRGQRYEIALNLLRRSLGWKVIQLPRGMSRSRYRCTRTEKYDRAFVERWFSLSDRITGDREALHPANFHRDLLPALFEDRALRIEMPDDSTIVYCIIMRPSAAAGIYGRREIRFDDGCAYHDVLYADPPPPKDLELSKELLVTAVKYYRRLGLREITLTAGLNIGGLLWPKFGFRPATEQAWEQAKPKIRKNLRLLSKASIAPYLSEIEVYLADPDPTAIWNISNIKALTAGTNGQDLGSFLLQGTRWPGILRFDDEEAWAIFVSRVRRA